MSILWGIVPKKRLGPPKNHPKVGERIWVPAKKQANHALEIPGLTSELTKVEFQPLWLDLVGLLLAGLGLWLLIRMFGKADDISPEDSLLMESQ